MGFHVINYDRCATYKCRWLGQRAPYSDLGNCRWDAKCGELPPCPHTVREPEKPRQLRLEEGESARE
jgi:hypothetical protein